MTQIPAAFKHQQYTISFCEKKDRVFDMSDPGTGKTRAHAEAFGRHRKKKGGCGLVLAPKSILEAAWANDIARFCPTLKAAVVVAEKKDTGFLVDADIFITNIDMVNWLAKRPASFFKRFDYLIIDESTAYKHRDSMRSKAVAKIRRYFKKRRLLSGTPNPNGMCDLWHQMFILDDGQRLGTSFFAFRAAVCTPEQTGPAAQHVRWLDKEGSELAVMGLISDITVRHVLEECIDMPEHIVRSFEYNMPKKQLASYLKMERDAIMEIAEQKITAVNGAVLYSKLLQIASGAVYDEDGKFVVVDTQRYEIIADLIEERKQTVVFFQWDHQRDCLIQELKKRGLTFAVIDGSVRAKDRTEIVDNFQKGFYRAALLHPKSAGHGLTLTRAKTAIWASPTINAEWWQQCNHRIYRAGQDERTETIVMLAKDTRDGLVYSRCLDKDLKMASLLEELITTTRK